MSRFIRGLIGLLGLAPFIAATIIDPSNTTALRESYDYVIVGGGPSGLVVGNRLTENPSINVLILEAGVLDDESFQVQAPGSIGLQDLSRYDWKVRTTPQTFLNGADRGYPLGKAVGGGTITNGIVWTRASASDYDSWIDLGNEGWGWEDLLPYFIKSESYNEEVSEYGADTLGIAPDMSIHGEDGPVQVGYPKYFYHPQSENFLQGVQELGIPLVGEINSGNMTGACIAPSSMSLQEQSRASARTSYLNPVADRANLHLAIGQRVTRVLFDTSGEEPKATGVEFATNSTAPVANVTATTEVILSAGAIWTPTLLQISGIGPRPVLESLGVEVLVDLPGVGNNLQDHPMVSPEYDYSMQGLYTSQNLTGAEGDARLQEWRDEADGPYTTPMIHAVAFPAFPWVAHDWQDRLEAIRNGSVPGTLPDSYDETLRAGYDTQIESILGLLEQDDVAAYELMSTSYGQLTVSVMQPLSRGNVTASSKSVWDAPKIDPRFCSHPFDCDMLQIGLQFNDELIKTEAMLELEPIAAEGFGAGVSDEQLRESLYEKLISDYHPCSSAAMLSRDLGGVVDTSLHVYGTTGLRIIDASIMPTIPGAHLQSAVYAIAEKAVDAIGREWVAENER